jgi:murein DD-endopeptidase MepM/ murein hydrolase activator NlpD
LRPPTKKPLQMSAFTETIASRWQQFRTRLKDTYRLVIMNDDTFEEVGSYQLSLLNVYVALSSILVMVALLVVMLVAFTPLKKYIPGYGDTLTQEEYVELYKQVNKLEQEMEAHRLYADNMRRILNGESETAKDVEKKTPPPIVDTNAKSPALSDEEIQIRREVQIGNVNRSAREQYDKPKAGSRDIPLEQLFFVAPVTGEISASFNPDIQHYGIDIIAPKGAAIKAALDGYVFMADFTIETGNTIGIQHDNNIVTFYKHNAELLKKAGSFVKAGEAVAIIGNTGKLSTGPHLHFEMWHKGRPVDPADYISW